MTNRAVLVGTPPNHGPFVAGDVITDPLGSPMNLGTVLSNKLGVLNACNAMYSVAPNVVLATSGAGDLQTAINALTEGQILQVNANGPYSPITLPAGKGFKVRIGEGYAPTITGLECIKIADGAANIIISSLVCDNFTSGYANGRGGAVCMATRHAKCSNIVFYMCSFNNADNCSGVLIGYNDDADYATAPTLAQFSDHISFVDCTAYAANGVVTEGGNLCLRGVSSALIYNCMINAINTGRGIQLQDCTNALVENNEVLNCDDGSGNGEAIKLDELGTMVGYRNSGAFIGNIIHGAIEGIDIDDKSDAYVARNIVSRCSAEAITVDDSATAMIVGNVAYSSKVGVLAEVGSVVNLKNNVSFNNQTNYKMDNGYVVDASNVQEESGLGKAIKKVYCKKAFTLTAGDILAKYITLIDIPLPCSIIVMHQNLAGDLLNTNEGATSGAGSDYYFDLTTNRIKWDGCDLEAELVEGDTLRVRYVW